MCYVLWIESSAGVWKNLKARFSQSVFFWIFYIEEEVYNIQPFIFMIFITLVWWMCYGMNWRTMAIFLIVNSTFNVVVMSLLHWRTIETKAMPFDSSKAWIKNSALPNIKLCLWILSHVLTLYFIWTLNKKVLV